VEVRQTPTPAPEKTKIIVLRLENKTRQGRKDGSTGEDRLFGDGLRTQIVNALEQTGRFTVLENEGPRKVLTSDTLTDLEEIKTAIWLRLGSLSDAEFLLAGTLQIYRLSQESKNAGIDADLLFRESQASTINVAGIVDTAKKVFENLKPKDTDLVGIDLWLFDAKTGKRIALTDIQGIPSDSGDVIGGMFGQQLASVSGEMKTPMQQALRGSAIKAANWIAEQEERFRLQPEFASPPPTQGRRRKPLPTRPKPEDRDERSSTTKEPDSAKNDDQGRDSSLAEPPAPSDSTPSPTPQPPEWGQPPPKSQWGR
jgi:curli biogenesis system outer membrane secretion channel CsgG